MKPTLIILLLVLFVDLAHAGRVLIRKSDGFPIEYQSTDAAPGTLIKNNPQYPPSQVEEKNITPAEWDVLKEKFLVRPTLDQEKLQELNVKERLKRKFGWSDLDLKDIADLKN